MATVEELQEELQLATEATEGQEHMARMIVAIADRLIAAAREEGAEQMKAEIRDQCDFRSTNTRTLFFKNVYLVPASVLAPKEVTK